MTINPIDFERENMRKHGWYVHYVPEDNYGAGANVHTHGLPESFSHLDIQCTLPVRQDIIHTIFIELAERIKRGETFVVNQQYDDIIHHFCVEFIPAVENDRTVLRLVLPDKEGRLPSDPACDPYYKRQYDN
ncbi:hypothetical protein D3C71_1358880 [compost metagenome]